LKINDLDLQQMKLVRVLPKSVRRMNAKDFRIICDCQVHARRERTLWRRSLRFAQRAGRAVSTRGVALIVGVPLAFGAMMPTEAMNMSIPILAIKREAAKVRELPIFNTPRIRSTFGTPALAPQRFTFDGMKEEFFRTEVQYGSIIYREARRNNLAPELVAAVVEAESDFRPRLISHKNAQGLMQIIPETGRLMGADDLFDPEENIAAGTKYLRYLLDRFGDQRTALAAYNAGEGNVERFGGMPPFDETENYVRRVLSRTTQYRQAISGRYVASVKLTSAQ
jgi:soluble lytic murein transglycosylase-like protein